MIMANGFGLEQAKRVYDLYKWSWIVVTKHNGGTIAGQLLKIEGDFALFLPFQTGAYQKDMILSNKIVERGLPRAVSLQETAEITPINIEDIENYCKYTDYDNKLEEIKKEYEFRQIISHIKQEYYSDGAGI